MKALGISPGEEVLAPAYICTAAVEPIVAYGARVVFYKIRQDCQPDLPDIIAKVSSRTRALLAVHFFGFPFPSVSLQNLCTEYRLSLIEDCAHVLRGEVEGSDLGKIGDASVFSWRKFLPLEDGALLHLRTLPTGFKVPLSFENPLQTLKTGKTIADRSLECDPNSWWRQPYSLLDRACQALRNGRGPAVASVRVRDEEARPPVYFDEARLNAPMSRLSKWILRHVRLEEIVQKRRANYEYLMDHLQRIPGIMPLYPNLPPSVCPWVFPVFFEDFPNPHWKLRSRGIPAVSWGGVKSPLFVAADFPDAEFLYNNLVFLPLHQDLNVCDLKLVVGEVKNVREGQP